MADELGTTGPASPARAKSTRPRHALLVRVTHWMTVACFFALLLSGVEILISHPRFYWGETGNVNTRPLFVIPIPASRATVPTGYGYVLPDQNGWSRSLHFQSAWLLVFTGLLYVTYGLMRGHFRRELMPSSSDFSTAALADVIRGHLRLTKPTEHDAWSHNSLQRLTYLIVIFGLFPFVLWTGLAMAPSVTSAVPALVVGLGGRQSARTLHLLVSVLLFVFLLVHVGMVALSGFRNRVRAMITGGVGTTRERK